jgi:hypothetical protein
MPVPVQVNFYATHASVTTTHKTIRIIMGMRSNVSFHIAELHILS